MIDDPELTPIERAGYCAAVTRESAGAYRFAIREYEGLRDAWTAGRAFFTGASVYEGQEITVKLALIEAVSLWTPAACAGWEANAAEERARDKARRLVEGEA